MKIQSLIGGALLLAGLAAAGGRSGELVAEGDRAWARRAEGHRGARADPGPISEAVAAYRAAAAAEPANLAARWKLLRALYFQAEYALEDPKEGRRAVVAGRELAEESLDTLARRAGVAPSRVRGEPEEVAAAVSGVREAPALYFWAAVHWGLWGREAGKLAAARRGVARKVRDYAEIVIELDEAYELGGGRRLLGRLHSEAPRIPFFTGWVDRAVAVAELRRAMELGPGDLRNRLYLAEALWEHRPEERGEALRLLRELARQEPSPLRLVEEADVLRQARARLAEWGGRWGRNPRPKMIESRPALRAMDLAAVD